MSIPWDIRLVRDRLSSLCMTAFILHAFIPAGQWRRSLKISCKGLIDLLVFMEFEDERGPGRPVFRFAEKTISYDLIAVRLGTSCRVRCMGLQ
jgi:hypothetical protein